ncbi:MAG: hypothetical protein KatS3mg038_1562 [Candidatus Kapaibacterium sp.]|nr:MAG: hypothetical protein KatS3mg038_1562 [Candidatus Kapabacteria bacterium]
MSVNLTIKYRRDEPQEAQLAKHDGRPGCPLLHRLRCGEKEKESTSADFRRSNGRSGAMCWRLWLLS